MAVGNCISITVLIAFVYTFSWADNGKNLRDEDLHVHSKETPVLESSRLWHLYLISILLDWYQYSAFAFSVPDLKLPPSVQDLLDAFFAFGRFSLPFLPREVCLVYCFCSCQRNDVHRPNVLNDASRVRPFEGPDHQPFASGKRAIHSEI